ncbi:unnamed protein product [Parnassius apollo]|uniref:(apollo) hypothetical protein n=1 Tax=Parnassius apollo TaxID=110799 RepID=A0A8S3XTT8_PARAO|nr:unnamed protein product [Parnassius apollo]
MLKCIIQLVVEETNTLDESFEEVEDGELRILTYKEQIKKIQQWSFVYTHLAKATKLFNVIFGLQITVMLVSAIAYISTFLYTFIFISVNVHKNKSWVLFKICIKLILNQAGILLLSKAAQKMQNNVDMLKRCLATLLTYSLHDIEMYRATKDLLRFVSKRPLQIRAFGSIVVDMSLPPTCVMLFTSYTIIALQFNNVL